MALRTPPSWLQNGSHPAENDRLTVQAQYATTGTIGSGSFAITAQASPNMTVNAAAGWCAILGTTASSGVYTAYNDATTVLTITTASLTLPRIDRIVVTVSDSAYSGATNTVAFQVLAGTPAASPSAPATPSNSISLATIAVAALATSISAANITDTRTAVTSNVFLPLTGGTVTGATTFSGATTLSGTTTLSGATTLSNTTTLSGGTTLSGTTTISGATTISNATMTAAAGTATVAPIKLTSGTNLTSPQAGAFEYDGVTPYFTNSATSGRAVLPATAIYSVSLSANVALSQANNVAGSMFGAGMASGLAVVSGVLYEYEIVARINHSTTTTSLIFTIAGTATYTANPFIMSIVRDDSATSVVYRQANASSLQIRDGSGATGDTQNLLQIRGRFHVSASGFFLPQITFSAGATGSQFIVAGSYIKVTPIGNTAGTTSVGAWS